MLRPQSNAYRDAVALGGIWRCALDHDGDGHLRGWTQGLPGSLVAAVPGSLDEQLETALCDGRPAAIWLEREVTIPAHAGGRDCVLHFGSADLAAEVHVDGHLAARNERPFLPFTAALPASGTRHRVVVRLATELPRAHPLMGIDRADYDLEGREKDELNPPVRFDFFPYVGLHRMPWLLTRPRTRLERVDIGVDRDDAGTGSVALWIHCAGTDGTEAITIEARLEDDHGRVVATAHAQAARHCAHLNLTVPRCRAWSPRDPFLYRLVTVLNLAGTPVDEVDHAIGLRRVAARTGGLVINGEPVRLRGFGMHEDFPTLGKAHHGAVAVRDLALVRWTGANCVRTSHYPYAEEWLDLADRLGLLVISEIACVNLDFRHVDTAVAEAHRAAITAQIARDRHHPSVIMWSLGNEPGYLGEPEYRRDGGAYWESMFAHARALDATRPLMVANVSFAGREDPAFDHADVVAINRYWGWYTMPGRIRDAAARLAEELDFLQRRYGKPVLVSEFGADALAGRHHIDSQLFTEEYQADLIEAYLDVIERHPATLGALVWNFADFRTAQHHRRVIENLKGVFTRTREPKRAAWLLRRRWTGP